MDFKNGYNLLDEKKLLISYKRLQRDWKKTKSHNHKYESFEHYISKAALVCLINKKDRIGNKVAALSEYEFPNARRVDVLQLIKNTKEVVGYEIETSRDNGKKEINFVPIITIDLRKAPLEVHESFKILRKYFAKFVV